MAVPIGDTVRRLWPFTTADLTGESRDPVNLILTGRADPRQLRAALLTLDAARRPAQVTTGVPPRCTWRDAMGDVHAAYGEPAGWAGSAIQLACGPYDSVRVHVRFFALGAYTVAAAHLEVPLPGTADHQVLSWEVAEAFVADELARAGLMDATPGSTPPIHPEPTYRNIPRAIHRTLPGPLRDLVPGTVPGDVGIPTDGRATVLTIARAVEPRLGVIPQHLTIHYDQVVPRPFCAPRTEVVRVSGPVRLRQEVRVTAAGDHTVEFAARGRLDVVPFDPVAGLPTGSPYVMLVHHRHRASATDAGTRVSGVAVQVEVATSGSAGNRLVSRLDVGPRGAAWQRREVTCDRS